MPAPFSALSGPVPRPGGIAWWGPVGVVLGCAFLALTQLPPQWFGTVFVGILTLAPALAPLDRKKYFLTFLVLAVPVGVDVNLYFHPSALHRSTHGFVIHVSFFPLLALFLIWGIRAATGSRPLPVSTTGLVPLGILFAVGLLALARAQSPLFVAFDLFGIAWAILLYEYVSSELRDRQELRYVIALLSAIVGLEGTIAVAQHLTGSTLGLGFFGAEAMLVQQAGLATISRVGGTLGHPATLALFFTVLLPLPISLLFAPLHTRSRLFLVVVVLLGCAGLVTSLSRTGFIATSFSIALVLVIQLSKRMGSLRAGLAAALTISLVAALVLGTPNLLRTRLLEHDYGMATGRLAHMEVALKMIEDHLLFGVGLNHYVEVARQYDTSPEQILSWWKGPVHNLFLFLAGEMGLVGALAMVGFLVAVLRALLPAMRAADPMIGSAGLGLFAGLLGFVVQAQIDLIYHWPRVFFLWFVLGLAVAMGRLAGTALEGGTATVLRAGR